MMIISQLLDVKLKLALCLLLSFLFVFKASGQADDTDEQKNKGFLKGVSLKDPEDGAFDMSAMMESHSGGIVPFPIIITEPAVGYGGGLALIYLKNNKSSTDKVLPADATGIAGFGTQNRTWALMAFHFNSIKEDKIRYLGGAMYGDINIDFYFKDLEGNSQPVEIGMKSWGVLQRVLFRIANTGLFIGPQYTYFHTRNRINDLDQIYVIPGLEDKVISKSALSMPGLFVQYDSRNSTLSPDKGMLTGLTTSYSATFLGSDHSYWMFNPYFIGYVPVSKRVFSGYRFDSQFGVGGDLPFYARPFLLMRGVPAAKYQGDITMLVETEWRGVVYRRWSLVGFAGTGKAFDAFKEFGDSDWIYSYGVGFRYLLARRNKFQVGMDFGWSNNGDFAFYLIFGSYWNK
jgi:hypothetical protein